jgi:hypothetical protein
VQSGQHLTPETLEVGEQGFDWTHGCSLQSRIRPKHCFPTSSSVFGVKGVFGVNGCPLHNTNNPGMVHCPAEPKRHDCPALAVHLRHMHALRENLK